MKLNAVIAELQSLQRIYGNVDTMFIDIESYTSINTPTPGALPVDRITIGMKCPQNERNQYYVLLG